MDCHSDVTVSTMFYSDAFQAWRIQCIQRHVITSQNREQSIYIKDKNDAENINMLLPAITSWEAWLEFVQSLVEAGIRKTFTGSVYVCGTGFTYKQIAPEL